MKQLTSRDKELSQAKRELLRRRLRGKLHQVIPQRPVDVRTPLSFEQERLWFIERYEEGTTAYNLASGSRIRGVLFPDALARALTGVVARHEILRTVFPAEDGVPFQVVVDPEPLIPLFYDLTEEPETRREARLAEMVRLEVNEPFDLANGPAFRVALFKMADRDHVLLLLAHHIVVDAWSFSLLHRETITRYVAELEGRALNPAPLPLQYGDYAHWQRDPARDRARAGLVTYWKERLAGRPERLNLPADYPRDGAAGTSASHPIRWSPELSRAIGDLAQREGATPFMVLWSLYSWLLHRFSGDRDLLVGTPVANRNRPELEPLIGYFVNTLVLRSHLEDRQDFLGHLHRIKTQTLSDFQHRDLPFDLLVRELNPSRTGRRSPLFRAMFVLETAAVEQRIEDREFAVRPYPVEADTVQFDLSLALWEGSDGFHGQLQYDATLFSSETVAGLVAMLERLAQLVVRDPRHRLDGPLVADASAREAILAIGRGARRQIDGHEALHALFERQARRTPHQVAVVFEDEKWTYEAVNLLANRVAHGLMARGVGPDRLVGVHLDRCAMLPVVLLGILKAGAAYLPLDPDYPAARLRYMVGDANPILIVGESDSIDFGDVPLVDPAELTTTTECGDPEIDHHPELLAYVIYTSGSTGRPKGVMNNHGAIVNRLAWMQHAFGLTQSDVCVQKTPFSFDVSVWEFFWPLLTGASLVVAKPKGHMDARYLSELIDRTGITTIHFVPSMLDRFLAAGDVAPHCTSLERVICSGEALSPASVSRFHDLLSCALHNLYGPTEAAVDVTAYACRKDERRGSVPIGRPIDNTDLSILDEEGHLAPIGFPGELYIGGVQLARGYHGRPALTAERFVPNPASSEPGARLYRTGDRARLLGDGNVEYLGRLDGQIKLRGVRIELGEIETVLGEVSEGRSCRVLLREIRPGEPSLVAYIQGAPCDTRTLRERLADRLTLGMVPGHFVFLDAWPLTPNGKLDRSALPEPMAPTGTDGPGYQAPCTDLERKLAAIWAEILDRAQVGIHDDFFASGGHSLAAARVVARIESDLGLRPPVRSLFDNPTIATLAQALADAHPKTPIRQSLMPVPRDGRPPLSPAQQRLWFLNQLDPESTAYNMPVALRLTGPLNPNRLAEAFTSLRTRHEILRTRFLSELGEPYQVIDDPIPVALSTETPPPETRDDDRAAWIRNRIESLATIPFDLAKDPLLRVTLFPLGPDDQVLFVNTHHIVSDGWSQGILVKEVTAWYRALGADRSPNLARPTLQFADVAVWQRDRLKSAAIAHELAFWRHKLAGVQPVGFPPDHARPALRTPRGSAEAFTLPAELSAALNALSRREGSTLFMTLLAGLKLVLAARAGVDDIAVGTPVAGRDHRDTESLIGLFVNTLVVRTRIGGTDTFRELLRRVRHECLEAFNHQQVPFDQVVDHCDLPHVGHANPLFQVMFVLQNAVSEADTAADGLKIEPFPFETGATQNDVTLHMTEEDGTLRGRLEYNRDLYAAASVVSWIEDYRDLLTRWAAEPDLPLASIAWFHLDALTPPTEPGGAAAMGAGATSDPTGLQPSTERRSARATRSETTAAARQIQAADSAQPQEPAESTISETVDFLVTVWQAVLGRDDIDPRDHFFDHGGNSLSAVRAFSRIHQRFPGKLKLPEFFEHPTPVELAAFLERGTDRPESDAPKFRIEPRSPGSPIPLSFAQERLWFLDHHSPGSSYHIPVAFRVIGPVDPPLLSRALAQVMSRHESLRTWIEERDGVPHQRIVPVPPDPLQVVRPAGTDPNASIRAYIVEDLARPFDLAQAPLARFVLFPISTGEHVLYVNLHHLIGDAWSLELLVREWVGHYTSLRRGITEQRPALAVQYGDFALWQRQAAAEGAFEGQRDYWRRKLGGVAPTTIPGDHARPAVQTFRGRRISFDLPGTLQREMAALAETQSATPFMAWLAVFQLLFHKVSGQADVTVGTPIAGRTSVETEDLIGLFINTLVIRTQWAPQLHFGQWLERLRETCLEAFQHQDIPFERIVTDLQPQRSSAHSPLFQVMFVYQNVPAASPDGLDEMALEPFPFDQNTAKFDVTLTLIEGSEGLSGVLEFNADLYETDTMQALVARFENLAGTLTSRPDQPLSRISPLLPGERANLAEWHRTAVDYGPDFGGSIPARFAAQAARTPDLPAVRLDHRELSYAALGDRVNRLARVLVELGAGPDIPVGVYMGRCLEWPVALLAVLQSGSAYVPLDPGYPAPRLAAMIADSGLSLVISADGSPLPADLAAPNLVQVNAANPPAPTRNPTTLPKPHAEQLAYIAYTSGSSGTPKGVMVTHGGLANYVSTCLRRYTTDGGSLIHSSPAFDLTVTGLFPILLAGKTVTLVGEGEGDPTPADLVARGQRFGLLKMTPTHLTTLRAQIPAESWTDAFETIVLGGEALTVEQARFLESHAPSTRVLNEYGPTETVVGCTVFTWDGATESTEVSIGRALPNCRIHLLDDQLNPVVPGTPGELWISGDQLARGYHRQPALTAARFVPDPFSPEPGGRMYRSGDLARYGKDGHIQFMGRRDAQLKWRGYRIEAGDIETALTDLPAIASARVRIMDDAEGRTRLTAYLVAAPDVDASDPTLRDETLRSRLGTSLPAYMVPTAFVRLDALPLTANGKLDEGRLPRPGRRESTNDGYAPPSTETERILAGLWAEVLGVDRVGRHDNYFDLGGDSILSIQVVAKAAKQGIALQVRDLFEHQTVASLAAAATTGDTAPEIAIHGGIAETAERILSTDVPLASMNQGQLDDLNLDPKAIADLYPLSPLQQGMLFHALEGDENSPYFTQMVFEITGPFDLDLFRRSWLVLAEHHPIFRTSFVSSANHPPLQMVHRRAEIPIDFIDEPLDPDSMEVFLAEDRNRGFALTRPPLMRFTVSRQSSGRYRVIWSHHHLLLDGWCIGLLLDHFGRVYGALADGRTPELPPSRPYRDFIAYLAQRDCGAEQTYWRGYLSGFTDPTPLPHARPTDQPAAIENLRHRLPADLTEGLQTLARRLRITPATFLQCMWGLLLGGLTGTRDVVFGTVVSGRPGDLVGADTMIGLFINTLPVRIDTSQPISLETWLQAQQRASADQRDYEHTPLARIHGWSEVDRDRPLFQTLFAYENFPFPAESAATPGEGLHISGLQERSSTNYPLCLAAVPGNRLSLDLQYDASRVDEIGAGELLRRFEWLVRQAIADPRRRLDRLQWLTPEEHRHLFAETERVPSVAPRSDLADLFERSAAQSPTAVALDFPGTTLTYAALNGRANHLAARLASHGVTTETPVAICLPRSVEALVAILAVVKCGAAYVPLDPESPSRRLDQMIATLDIHHILCGPAQMASLQAHRDHLLVFEDRGDTSEIAPKRYVPIDALAAVFFTSGSTGGPKPVGVTHRAIARLVLRNAYLDIHSADRMALAAHLAFDAASFEIWGGLMHGATLVGIDADTLSSADHLAAELHQRRVSILFQTTALVHQIAQLQPEAYRPLRVLLFGGEAAVPRLIGRVRSACPDTALHHMYGPTECTTFATWHPLGRTLSPLEPPPIGRPITGMAALVLDAHLRPVPEDTPGELYLSGPGLSRGYLTLPSRTATSFLPHPFATEPGTRMYRTGDIVKRDRAGNLVFLNRRDHQVKLRGFRIETHEIEQALETLDGVRDSLVTLIEDRPGEKFLCAYLLGGLQEVEPIRRHLANLLPKYMVPAAFVFLDAFPLTANGKVDRRALPRPERGTGELPTETILPETDEQRILVDVWQRTLGIARIGIHQNYFDLGGDSILSIQIVARAKAAGLHLSPGDLFRHQTIAELANVSRRALAMDAEQGPIGGPAALTPIQLWFFERDLPEAHHFNQSMMLTCDDLDAEIAERAIAALVDHHDALRLRFARDEDGRWTARHGEPIADRPAERQRHFRVASLSSEGDSDELIRTRADIHQAGLNLSEGPLFKGVLFQNPSGQDHLLLVCHHLVIDGVSWRILLEDLESAVASLTETGTVTLPAKSTSWQSWARRLHRFARQQVPGAAPVSDLPAPVPVFPELVDPVALRDLNLVGHVRTVHRNLDGATTRALLQEVNKTYRTRIDDLLLTALAGALATRVGGEATSVTLETHGRAELFQDVDLSRTVGWFTAMVPVCLSLREKDQIARLKRIKETLREIRNAGIEPGLSTYLRRADQNVSTPHPQMSFNYLGQMDGNLNDSSLFRVPDQSLKGTEIDASQPRAHLLDIVAIIVGGQLHVSWSFVPQLVSQERIEALADAFHAALADLIAHCATATKPGYTPSDFPLAGLDQAFLDHLAARQPPIADVYPPTPLQAGMLFHTLSAPKSGQYITQMCFRLAGRLDPATFEAAWATLAQRHAVLRTAFLDDTPVGPRQMVLEEVALPIRVIEASAIENWQAFLMADRCRGFDPRQAPLMRLTLVPEEEGRTRILWTHHHALIDGWCLGLILDDFARIYTALLAGERPDLPTVRPYRDFVAYLACRDEEAAKAFWIDNLADFTEPTPLPMDLRPPITKGSSATTDTTRRLSRATTGAIDQFHHQYRITTGTLLQGLWGLVLAQFANREEALFGSITSGRPADLEGSERMIGLFINTLPLRIRIARDRTLYEWLGTLQETLATMREHESLPLSRIVQWSEVPTGTELFHSLFAYENYPLDTSALSGPDQAFSLVDVETSERTNYPLVLAAGPGETLTLRLQYDGDRISSTQADLLLDRFTTLIEAAVAHPEWTVDTLLAPDPETCLRLARVLNPELVTWEGEENLVTRFASIASRHPRRIALSFGDLALSYEDLDRQANQLAHHLMALGVGLETAVAVGLKRGPQYLVSILAILKAGGAYVPIDPDLPPKRIQTLLGELDVPIVITGSDAPIEGCPSRRQLVWEPDRWSDRPHDRPCRRVPGQALANVVFTSGTTGNPKATGITHTAILRTVDRSNYGQVEPGDRVAHLADQSFDASTWEVWAALANGATLVTGGRSASHLGHPDAIFAARPNVMFLTTALFNHFARSEPRAFNDLRLLLFGGERVNPDLVGRVMAAGGPAQLVHVYGPTETTIYATRHRVSRDDIHRNTIAIGTALSQTQAYVLDPCLKPVPLGHIGELYLGGPRLARGYLGRPGPTAERFLPDPFSGVPGARMYRTGDQVRLSALGQLEFVGRFDHQVKLRGFRIECAEVATVVSRVTEGRQALVVLDEADPADPFLVAYVEGSPLDIPTLRQRLTQWLPDYMIPSQFLFLDRFPLTARGKVDRRALPIPQRSRSITDSAFVPPRNETEAALAAIWAEVLGLESVGVHDDFFALGGHSLKAMRVANRVASDMALQLPIADLFAHPTISALAPRLTARPMSALPSLVPVPGRTEASLSFAQERFWFLDKLSPNRYAYAMPLALRFRGPFSAQRMAAAMTALVTRHQSLRTRFPERNGHPVADVLVDPASALEFRVLDWRTAPAGEPEARAYVTSQAKRPFDLAEGPLVRLHTVSLADDDHVLFLNLHHILSDGWSQRILARELVSLYRDQDTNRSPRLTPLPLQYADYAAWQRNLVHSAAFDEQLDFWRHQLAGLTPATFPTDRARGGFQTYRGGTLPFSLNPVTSAKVVDFAQGAGVTPFMVLLAAFKALFHRLSRCDDLSVGTPVAGRRLQDLEPLIGLFINTLVVRTRFDGSIRFTDLVDLVRRESLAAMHHQDVPFEKTVAELQPDRDTSHSPLFQVMFVYHAAEDEPGAMPAHVDPFPFEFPTTKFDLTLTFTESSGDFHAVLEYNRDLYLPETAQRLAAQFQVLTEGLLRRPDLPLTQQALIPEDEFPRWVALGSGPRRRHRSRPPLARCFADQVARTPNTTALVVGSRSWTYAEFGFQVAALAQRLVEAGVGPETRVGMYLGRRPEWPVAVFAILAAGCAFVPLDPDYPERRLAHAIADADIDLVISARGQPLPESLGTDVEEWAISTDEAPRPKSHLPDPHPLPESTAYVLYTSGSTGLPKGVMVTHEGLENYLDVSLDTYRYHGGDSTLIHSSPAFDLTLTSLLPPLLCGRSITLVDHADPVQGLAEHLTSGQAFSLVKLTPTHLDLLRDSVSPEKLAGVVGDIVIGGEALTRDQLEWLHGHAPDTRLINEYGPTETVVGCTTFVWGSDSVTGSAVPIGKATAGTELYLLDDRLNPVPVGVPGVLYIGGAQLARGYQGNPAETAARFVPNPFSGTPGARMYRSGDVAKFLPDGNILFEGRCDQQLKWRGHRIEPGEIETVLARHPGIETARVLIRDDAEGRPHLAAYVVMHTETKRDRSSSVDWDHLHRWLGERLPAYMVPTDIVTLAALPLTANGKLDRNALPRPNHEKGSRPARSSRAPYMPPRDVTERRLTEIWARVLDVARVGVDDHFFQLGGHSLMAVTLVDRIQTAFGQALPLAKLFSHPTVRQMASLLRSNQGLAVSSPMQPSRESDLDGSIRPYRTRGSAPPLFLIAPGGGGLAEFEHLVAALPTDRPCYGISCPTLLDPAIRFESVQDLAAHYIAILENTRPEGPYALLGWSFGGLVAFEMAHQLSRSGAALEQVVLVDASVTPRWLPVEGRRARYRRLVAPLDYHTILGRVGDREAHPDLETFIDMSEDERLTALVRLAQSDLGAGSDQDMNQLRAFLHTSRQSGELGYRYTPPKLGVPFGYVRAEIPPSQAYLDLMYRSPIPDGSRALAEVIQGTGLETDPSDTPSLDPRDWSAYAGNGMHLLRLPGSHRDMLLGHNAVRIAEWIGSTQPNGETGAPEEVTP
ncbi:Non-ribosomal peptide synthase/polyketide synthase [Sulfidibacter corallicola]|uniref:Non-ribosomal peptide synthase/polyketide synthase n=1 Tax=Sulfidibacter corallicola TaxID=2818388 RepID=A0A8A4TLG2_SULCO|nr:non-ribosomal peptide synthetase [Sulfidibacter corallicola]QTD50044.1 non-ribosomal peptide synthase/polyketide synthase [Sulfidibacter corallicola]